MSDDNPSTLAEWAYWYVTHGFAVIPLGERSKKPCTAHGLHDWTDNPQNVLDHWAKYPNHNIGLVCGNPSGAFERGLLVLDFDVSDDKDGTHTLREWETLHGELPETAQAETGGGGTHMLYLTDRKTIRPSVNHELGVDVRSDGSYIVAPPSVHPSGELYTWWASPIDVGIATADGNVADFLDYVQRNGGEDEMKSPTGKFRLPDKIARGKRDDTLFKYGSHLRAIGRRDDEILQILLGTNMERCEPPLDSTDVRRIAKSACRYERGDDDSREVGRPGASACTAANFRNDKGRILTNKLGTHLIENYRACIIDGAPAIWNGKRWEFGKRAIARAVLKCADDAKETDKNEVFSYVQDKAPHVDSSRSFDGRHYVQFDNTTLCITEDERIFEVEPTPDMYIVGTMPIAWNEDLAVIPGIADAFIQSVSDGDEKTAEAMCEVIGACMCSTRMISQSPMLLGRAEGIGGEASNGKSTYINAARALLGPNNVSSMDIATIGQRFQASYLLGKLANLGDDIPNSFLQGNELSMFKKVVTGDTIFTDIKNGAGFDFKPSATFVFSMNSFPKLSDSTDGVLRRLAFIPFRRRFSPGDADFDPMMLRKLTTDEALVRLAMLGLKRMPRLIESGRLTEVPDMAEAIEEVIQDNNSVARWLYEADVRERQIDGSPVADVYELYTDWCKRAGERNPYALRTFSKKIRSIPNITEKPGFRAVVETQRVAGVTRKVFAIKRIGNV